MEKVATVKADSYDPQVVQQAITDLLAHLAIHPGKTVSLVMVQNGQGLPPPSKAEIFPCSCDRKHKIAVCK